MAKIIAVVNQKGGVGKTTSTVNLAASVALKGQKVLLMDIDPQGNATSGLGVNKRELETSSYDVIVNALPIEKAILKTEFDNLWVLPSNMNLAGAELELVDMKHRESKIKNAVAPIKADFDFIFLDCPPSLGLITLNALCAADTVLVPIQCEYYALEGLSQLMNTVRLVRMNLNPVLDGGRFADYVRRQTELDSAGGRRAEKIFPEKGVCHGNTEKCQALRSSELRTANTLLRQKFKGCGGI